VPSQVLQLTTTHFTLRNEIFQRPDDSYHEESGAEDYPLS